MALQDKFDQAFVQSILKKTLVSSNKVQVVTASNDNSYELTKSNLETLSNSFTSLQNTFNKIYAHTLNVRNLHRYQEKSIVSIKRENSLENKITPGTSPVSSSDSGSSLSSTTSILDSLASSVEKLNEKMKSVNLSGSGINISPLDLGGAPSKPMKGGLTDGPLNKRAMGGGVKANGTYLIGERGPEVLMLGGLSGKVIANGRRGREAQSEKYLMAAADRSSRAAATVIKGQPPGPTSYSSKFSNYLGSLFSSMPNWLNGIKNWLGFGGTGMPGAPGDMGEYGEGAGSTENARIALDFFMSPAGGGWTREQAAGIVGNLQGESSKFINPKAVGDGGDAYGIAQWNQVASPDRVANFKKVIGTDLRQSNLQQQLKFVAWELQNSEKKAGNRLRNAKDVQSATVAMSYYERYKTYEQELGSRETRKRIANAQALLVSPQMAGGKFMNPVPSGRITSVWGDPRDGGMRMHKGVDIAARHGTAVGAAAAGTVVKVGVSGSKGGNRVQIDHHNGLRTNYEHLSTFNVKEGDKVVAGDKIGEIGNTGKGTGAHLHFAVWAGGEEVDPMPYLTSTPTTMHANQVPPKLPAGYSIITKTVPFTKGQKTQIVVIKTPSGYEIPRSAKGTADVPSYKGASGNGKREIEAYFRLGGTV
jgi:murein DD-endopeptidase MepM/ murein hydrolase activator NlpD